MPYPRSHALRNGRRSIKGHYYLITMATQNRHPWFLPARNARIACRHLYSPAVSQLGETLSYVVMPDHVHWLIQLSGEISKLVRIYKAKVSLDIGTTFWQQGFHDHAIRQESELKATARYIVANPLRAGLVNDIGQYPYWNAVWL
ncbi:hypothetical protein L861_02135 [Litchfieldella anticariensis FP35 = DSM 16096]|uniref:Transposase IS200-like domain-containing protein n=1 Tax=Litchfieldella anticariensis (strain DSM 16096 / CECT 5854 / CIP 108499 / LMG 22089 / FP35) TaxID=1121939 RepID=S2KPV5_LITA3|nr:transposase [Halomonas anticariensis]EPC04132.1 hypothetical protein L861_02135 [Halomonas anticariensis FP35 = DSM 16096]